MNQQEINNSSMLKKGTILRGIYRIDSYLSSGGFGNTYVATNIEFGERVAIKEFFMKGVTQRDGNQMTVSVSNAENTNSFLEQKEKFKKEARRIRQLKNEHIVAVYDLFDENETSYYVMDYVDGENLAERMRRTGRPMEESEVRLILPQILDALKAVHEAGIWHLDLKPDNIMLDKSGKIKLIDFGASKQLNVQKGGATASTAISYTKGYAPREQMEQNYDKFGPWTDIYALGATLYNLLTNKRPPLPTDIDDDMSEDKHLALPMPNVCDEMKELVLQMMKTNRLQRPQNIDAIIIAETPRKEEPQKSTTSTMAECTASYSEEVTIVSAPLPPLPKKDKKNFEYKQEPKVINQTTARPSYNSYSQENNNRSALSVGCMFFLIIFGLTLFIVAIYSIGSCVRGSLDTDDSSYARYVEKMEWESPIGHCQYFGPIDETNTPNGEGQAFFNDGRYYKGNFEHGTLTGDDCYFQYAEGDAFNGQFRNNSFYYGEYTIAKDNSYFIGFYDKGKPSSGSWYDKNGKVIEIIK